MKNILIHGLGQNETSWNIVEIELNLHNIKIEKPNLYSMLKIQELIILFYIKNLRITVTVLARN